MMFRNLACGSFESKSASLGMYMYAFRIILADTFAAHDMDLVINQLIVRGNGLLDLYAKDRGFFLQTVNDIMEEYDLGPPAPKDPGLPGTESSAHAKAWIKTFYEDDFHGPPEKERWRDQDLEDLVALEPDLAICRLLLWSLCFFLLCCFPCPFRFPCVVSQSTQPPWAGDNVDPG